MLVGQFGEYPAAVMTFTDAACDHTQPMHIASCTVTLYASQGGEVLQQQLARLPVAEHMEPNDILVMFQMQFSALPMYDAMVPA